MKTLALTSSDTSFEMLFHLSPIGMAISTLNEGVFLEVNDAYCAVTGYSRDELIGRSSMDLHMIGTEARARIREAVQHIGFVRDMDVDLTTPTGEVRIVTASMHTSRFQGQQCLITTVMDMTERRRMEAELERLSQIDALTGLANRRHFLHLAHAELARTTRYGGEMAVLMLDIDHFKNINDTHGHQTGDQVIKTLGQLCRDTFREVDIVGRLGGEEFAAVLPRCDRAQALGVAERLRAAVAARSLALPDGAQVQFAVSVGVAALCLPRAEPEADIESLLNCADQALYDAKRSGRNRVCAYLAAEAPVAP